MLSRIGLEGRSKVRGSKRKHDIGKEGGCPILKPKKIKRKKETSASESSLKSDLVSLEN